MSPTCTKSYKPKHSTLKLRDKQQGRVERNVNSSNLNGLCAGFSFQYNTISNHKINIIRKYPTRECKFKAVLFELSRNSELQLL